MIRDGLDRYDVLSRQGEQSPRGGVSSYAWPAEAPEVDLDDEPVGGPAGPRRGWLRRIDRRTRSILVSAAAAAVIVNAGAMWAYWHITGSETGRANAGAVVELNLRGRSDLNKPLTPGGRGDLVVTVTNDNDYPLRITSVSAGPDGVVADIEHRENGCVKPAVVVAHKVTEVSWDVERNNVAAFTVPGGLTMAESADPACVGAVFTVPVVVSAVAGVSPAR
jgi:hypothetical protein